MPSGLDSGGGFVTAPTDLPGFGDIQWADAGMGWGRATSGGDWPEIGGAADAMAYSGQNDGFSRISTGENMTEPVPGAAGRKSTDWRFLLNWQHNPTFWILVFALAAVGFVHARLSVGGSVGRARAGFAGRV